MAIQKSKIIFLGLLRIKSRNDEVRLNFVSQAYKFIQKRPSSNTKSFKLNNIKELQKGC
jgi:hypothetical protein